MHQLIRGSLVMQGVEMERSRRLMSHTGRVHIRCVSLHLLQRSVAPADVVQDRR